MIREALQGLGVVAYGDPNPGPRVPAGLSYSPGTSVGRIRLVGSKGVARDATYLQIYRTNPFVYAATNYVARGIGRLPLHVFELNREAEKERVRYDTVGARTPARSLDEVLNRPQGRISRSAFWSGTARQRLIYGNSLWRIVRERGGPPTGLERVPWGQVSHVEEDSWGNVLFYEVRPPQSRVGGNRRLTLAPDEVIHFGLGTEGDQACGVSLLESCSATLALHEVLLRHLLAYFENSARPSGHLRVEKANKDKVTELRELLTALYASPENAGQILVTSGYWEKTGDSPEHSQIVELLGQSRVEIAAAFQVPPPILGLLEHAIRANVKEMREQFGRETLGPWAAEFEDELESQLIKPVDPAVFCEFQLAEQLRPDLEARALVYQRLMHVFTIDEIRGFENQMPLKIPGVTDIPWVASGAAPLSVAAKPKPTTVRPPAGDDDPAASLTIGEAAEAVRILDAIAAASGNGHHD